MIQHFFSKQFLTYLLIGGTAATVNFCSRIVFNSWFNFSTSVILSYFAGMATTFALARIFVFKQSQQNFLHSIFFFCLVNLITIIQTWLISMGFAYYLLPSLHITAFAYEVSHAAGIGCSVFTSYLGHKYWSFR